MKNFGIFGIMVAIGTLAACDQISAVPGEASAASPVATNSGEGLVNAAIKDQGIYGSWYGVGEYTVYRDTPVERARTDIGRGVVSMEEYAALQCMVAANYLVFDEDEDLSQRSTAERLMAFGSGKARRIVVSMTPEGVAASTKYASEPWAVRRREAIPSKELLFIRASSPKVASIIEDKTITKDVNEYRLIKARLTTSPTPEGQRQIDACSQSVATDGNMKVLFKKDTFSGEWDLVTWDYNFTGADLTMNVENALAKAQ